MTIKSKLLLNGLSTFTLALAIGVTLVVTSQAVMKEFAKQKIVEEIVKGVTGQRGHLLEYILFREERPVMQWYAKETELRALFASRVFQNPDEQKNIAELRDNLDSRKSLFTELVANYERSRQISDQKEHSLAQEVETRTISQLLVKAQEAITNAFQLTALSRTKVIAAQERSGLLVALFILLLLAFAAGAMFIINQTVIKPLVLLHKGTEVIAGGNLDYNVDIQTKDEIGQLSRSFNEMAGKLKASYSGLEEKVKERTKVLEEKTAELERMNKLMVGRELKMIELKKEIEELKKQVNNK